MAIQLLEKNSVFYRFASEDVVERIEFTGRQIAVGDLKQAISEIKKLNKLDLALVNEATNEVYVKDGALLPRNMTVTVRRTPPQTSKKPSVVHIEHGDVWSKMSEGKEVKKEEMKAPIQRRACPPEYLCPLCGDIYDDPHIARCCGRSACSRCFKTSQSASPNSNVSHGVCPLCRAEWTNDSKPIRNPRLADSVASLDLDYFVLPSEVKAKAAAKRKAEEEAAAANIGSLPGLPPGALMPPSPPWGLPPPSLPPPSPPTAPPGAVIRPCMLSPEQFLAWQRSIREDDSSDSDRRRRRKKHKASKKSKRSRRDASGSE